MADKVTPELSQVGVESTRVTVEDLSNPEHPVNNKGASGKRSGMGLIIQGHLWVAEGPNPDDKWYRVQKHVEETTAILRSINNTSQVASNASFTYQPVTVDSFLAVEPFLTGSWDITNGLVSIEYTGNEAVFRFEVSGDITTQDSSGTGDNIGIQIFDYQSGEGLTGATKVLPVTKVQGSSTSLVDFTLIGYARVSNGDKFELQVTSDFSGDLLTNNLLFTITPLDTLLYI